MKENTIGRIAMARTRAPRARSSWTLCAATLTIVGASMEPVLAADPSTSELGIQLAQAANPEPATSPSAQTGPQQPSSPAAVTGGGGAVTAYTIPTPPAQSQNPYALADQLKLRGWIVPLPGAANTLDQGLLGVRDALAEAGISYLAFESTSFQDNLLRHELPPGVDSTKGGNSKQEQYNGQLPTYSSSIAFFAMYDLRRYGIPDGQITLGGSSVATNWNPSLPNGIALAVATYYQTFFNKRVEFKIGYQTNSTEFLGAQVGGNLAGGIFGVNAAVSYENGENIPSLPTPGVNVKVYLPDSFYTKVGVQRGLSPGGVLAERLDNPSALHFSVPGAGAFVIDETGYRINAAPGQMSTWIRAAANYTSSSYPDLTKSHTGPNYGLYLLADRQLLKTAPRGGPATAFQGLYGGFSINYGPPNVDAFTQYYELRLYGFGLVPGRPFDQLSLVANRNVFSGYAVRQVRLFGLLAHDAANTYTAAYSAHVLPGVNLNFGIAYVDHPTIILYDRSTGSGLNILLNTFIFL